MESKEDKESMIDINEESFKKDLGLLPVIDNGERSFLMLDDATFPQYEYKTGEEGAPKKIESAQDFFVFFENASNEKADNVCRATGATTLFTTAGVQHIETILETKNNLEKRTLTICQPVIRSQFMDKAKEGTSTSFVNLSVEGIKVMPAEYLTLSRNFIHFFASRGVKLEDLRFKIVADSVKWGSRRFKNLVLKVYLNSVEVGDCVYIKDFPVGEDSNINIADIGIGVERFNWAIDNASSLYFQDLADFYIDGVDRNKMSSIIDSVRTMVLIAGEGVKPSLHDHGYRLRQLSKRFIQRKIGVALEISGLIHSCLESWKRWGYKPNLSEESVIEIIKAENDRNLNSLFLLKLKESGTNIQIDINQSVEDFIRQMRFSITEEVIDSIIDKIK